jgi:hypothetical protein
LAEGSDKPIALNQGDKDYPVASGDKVQCTGDGELILDLGDHTQTVRQRDGWVKVQRSSHLDDLHRSTDPAVTRGGSVVPVIYSPPPRGAARPEHLVVRWNPWPDIGDLLLTVETVSRAEQLCCKQRIPGATGKFDSPALQSALTSYRAARSEADDKFKIEIADFANRRYSTIFRLLAESDESKLIQALADWDRRDPITRKIGRAFCFKSFGLFSEAAEEYESALKVSPRSSFLLALAIVAERRTGNMCRAEMLKAREEGGQSLKTATETTDQEQCTLQRAP